VSDIYAAHIREDGTVQTVKEHNCNTAKLAVDFCTIFELKTAAYLAGILHDAGKNTPEFLEYLIKANRDPSSVHRGEVKHSFAGGWIISEIQNKIGGIESFSAELIRDAIISHHGLCDCVTLDGEIRYELRQVNEPVSNDVCEEVYKYISKCKLDDLFRQTISELDLLIDKTIALVNKDKGRVGSRNFYFGMSERMLMSLLINADRTDTACFISGKPLPQKTSDEALQNMWKGFLSVLEKKINNFNEISSIDMNRKEISQACFESAEKPSGIFRLVVPTGAGKTLSSLRYALRHAELNCKKHIIYIAPYNSILEQNANEIRSKLEAENSVLEHHCNIVFDEDGENARYKELTENWSSPIIATTAVQFLNTLFSAKTSSVRRMHALADSVIIIDEIQALPIKCVGLFNLAANYLSEICNSSVVLCSATQPLLDKLEKNSLIRPNDMILNAEKYFDAFRRTEIVDETNIIPIGLGIKELAEFATKKLNETENMLIIVNTKSCARNLFKHLKQLNSDNVDKNQIEIYHLSTNMCATHREDTLNAVRKYLLPPKTEISTDNKKNNPHKKMICVSTQLIEAGVDISFNTVIRSLAGLDNIVQAAGRCNRNCEKKSAKVFIVRVADENISSLVDIKFSQDAMIKVLYTYKNCPECIDNDLLSKKAMDLYYSYYFMNRKSEMDYNVSTLDITIVDLLSNNSLGSKKLKKKIMLKQAFKTAGENFQVISDNATNDIVVNYNEESNYLICEMNSDISIEKQMFIQKKLQRYSVSISDYTYKKLNSEGALYPLKNGGIITLRKEFYIEDIGVSENPTEMKALIV